MDDFTEFQAETLPPGHFMYSFACLAILARESFLSTPPWLGMAALALKTHMSSRDRQTSRPPSFRIMVFSPEKYGFHHLISTGTETFRKNAVAMSV